MIQSCITSDQYDDILDVKKEDQIRTNLAPS